MRPYNFWIPDRLSCIADFFHDIVCMSFRATPDPVRDSATGIPGNSIHLDTGFCRYDLKEGRRVMR